MIERRRMLGNTTANESDYLTFTALEDGTFTLTIPANVNTSFLTSVSYSLDDGATWVDTSNTSSAITITTPTITTGNTVKWKGVGASYGYSSSYYSKFSSTGEFVASGNIMSLLYGDNYNKQIALGNKNYTFCGLFNMAQKLMDVSNLLIPATALANYCYYNMFYGCNNITVAPVLPAKNLSQYCYFYMFCGCTSLVTPPELPATTCQTLCYGGMFRNCTSLVTASSLPATILAENCYAAMFFGCSGLINAPELPARYLKKRCYQEMFYGCTSLISAPELPATTLTDGCYNYMFQGCTSLNYIKALFTTTPSNSYTNNWVNGVASTGTFVKNISGWSSSLTGTNAIPSGWTVRTASS